VTIQFVTWQYTSNPRPPLRDGRINTVVSLTECNNGVNKKRPSGVTTIKLKNMTTTSGNTGALVS